MAASNGSCGDSSHTVARIVQLGLRSLHQRFDRLSVVNLDEALSTRAVSLLKIEGARFAA